ncbi:MAG: hypothetical protein WCO52_02140 [bacterium]
MRAPLFEGPLSQEALVSGKLPENVALQLLLDSPVQPGDNRYYVEYQVEGTSVFMCVFDTMEANRLVCQQVVAAALHYYPDIGISHTLAERWARYAEGGILDLDIWSGVGCVAA